MNPPSAIVLSACIIVTALLLRNLWMKQQGSVQKKKVWSLVVCIPFVGWLFYGAFYTPLGKNRIKAKGGASGWGHWGGA